MEFSFHQPGLFELSVLAIYRPKYIIFWVVNWQEGSDSERESNDASGIARKSQKRKRPKVQLSASKEDISQPWTMASNGGCLSLLKRARTDGITP